ncbi:MAG: 4-hydroxyphenylacetate 3-hydroxylase N-terminal domain-containing protein, partial [Halobacteriales archaeon]|nr:4-hydroxyphenylacetate 3-hydroxylase N-terminal domain-containing protein [Halobacteriales archaeon]
DDVTTHPATREMIHTQAELFDLQHDPDLQDQLTYESPTSGELVPIFYKLPETREDLEARRNASKIFHEYTCGFGGRASDFLASGMAGLAISADVFDAEGHQHGENVWKYYEHCRENDLCLTHAIIDPQIDRSSTGGSSFRLEGEAGHRPGALRMVDDRDDGIVVSGARMLATLGPQADEVLIFPFGHHGEDDADEAIAFALPIEAEGLRMICRPSLSANDRRNHPLSSRMDEMDVFMVFDEVFVPEDRIFVKGNPDVANDWRHTAQPEYATHQTLTKDLAKMEFILGVALLLAESTGIDEYFHVQAKLGEIAHTVQHVESGLWAMEAKAEEYGDSGYLVPDYVAGNATVGHFADLYRRCIDILQDLGGSGLVGIP